MASTILARHSRLASGLLGNSARALIGRQLGCSRNMTSGKFSHRIANPDDYTVIEKFLGESFLPHEPTIKALGFSPDTRAMKFFWGAVAECLAEPTSFITLNQSQKIVGACLNCRFHPIAETDDRWVKQQQLPAGMSTTDIGLAYVTRMEDGLVERLAAMESCSNQLLLSVICVDRECRGHGVGVKLVDLTVENARQRGYDCIVSQATAKASQILFKRYGFQVLNAVKHEDFTDENGTRLLTCEDGTNEGQLVFMKI